MNAKIDKKELRSECLINAKDLLEESKLLFRSQKYSRASSLAITSYEETLKAGLVNTLINGFITYKKFKKIWFKHELKYLLQYAMIRAKIYSNGETEFDLRLPSNRKKEVKRIFNIRNASLYVDYSSDKIYTPKKKIGVHQANKYIKIAQKQFEWEEMLSLLENRRKKESSF